MPTVGCQPSLKKTQAVGAVLLHQFARQRFFEAGIDDALIRDAEQAQNLDDLTSTLLESDPNQTNDLQQAHNVSQSNGSSLFNVSRFSQSSTAELDQTAFPTDSSTLTNLTCTTNKHDNSEQFHSVVGESSHVNNQFDNTVYHSMNAGYQAANSTSQSAAPPIDRALSLEMMAAYGRELRRIAEEFEKSKLRRDVKERAGQISLVDLNRETFHKLLEELFQDGVTRVKIVTLFFFCTDVALRAASFARELAIKLMSWSFSYVIDTVCAIVHRLGGWEHILFRQVPSILISCCAVLSIVALAVYIRRSILTNA